MQLRLVGKVKSPNVPVERQLRHSNSGPVPWSAANRLSASQILAPFRHRLALENDARSMDSALETRNPSKY